jgi:predicted acetyltransferase
MKIIKPDESHKKEFLNYVLEAYLANEKEIPLNYKGNYEIWLRDIKNEEKGINLKENRVSATTYFVFDNNKIVGTLSIRHNLDLPCVYNFVGHIGYNVRVSERNKGYGKKILELGLKECKKMQIENVLITCLESNIASKKIILSQGGILENKIYFEEEDENICRYIIKNYS